MKKTNKKNNTCKKEEQNANSKTKNLDVMMIEQEDITYKIMSDDDIEMMKMSDTTSANEKDNKKMMDNLEVMVNETIDKYNKTKLVTDQSNGINNDNNSISSDIMKDSQRNTQANSGKKTIIQIHNNDDNNSFTVKKEKKKKKKEKKNKGTVENGNSDENDITYNLDNNDEKVLNDRDEVNKTTIPSNDQSAASKTMMAPSSEKLTQPSIQSLKSSATKETNVPVNTLSTMESRKRKLDDKEVDNFSDKEMETLSNSKYMSDVHLSEKITPTINNKEHDKDKRKRKLVDKKVDKSNKRKRVPKTTLKGLSERFYKMFNLIPVDPIPFFVFASTVKDSFTCTDKSFSKKRELKFDTNYTKEEIEKIITKSLCLLREYVNKTYISDSITNDEFVTSFSLSKGSNNTQVMKKISRIILRGSKNKSEKPDKIRSVLLSLLEKDQKEDPTRQKVKRKKPIVLLPGGSIHNLQMDIANLLHQYFTEHFPRGFMIIYKKYIEKFVNDNNIMGVLFDKRDEISKEEFDKEHVVELIMMNIFHPKENDIYNFLEDDIIHRFILEERKRFIIQSIKNKTPRQRLVSKNLFCDNGNRYLMYLNELRMKLNMSPGEIIKTIFLPISIEFEETNDKYINNNNNGTQCNTTTELGLLIKCSSKYI
uniref:Uncharacterized protein n=2 Tax=unclassified Nimaviridae TaxID=2133791 RepID=A0A9C7EYI2_9VIRU|nr:MAG: hypothetical protein [Melicertus latisulcatus majanivirus]